MTYQSSPTTYDPMLARLRAHHNRGHRRGPHRRWAGTERSPGAAAQRGEELVLRDFNFCVIDEVDSILVDEARTPLIISGNAERPSTRYHQVRRAHRAARMAVP